MPISFRQKQKVIKVQQFGSRFPLLPLLYPCWTILVGRISSLQWTGVQPVALRLGVIVFALFRILHFKGVFELFIIKFPFSVSNEICDDRHQKKSGLISTLVIAFF